MWSPQDRAAVADRVLVPRDTQPHSITTSRRRVILGVAGAVVLAGIAVVPRFSVQAAQVRFEMRLAEAVDGPGLQRFTLSDPDRQIYLHAEALVTNGNITAARVLANNNIEVTFDATGAEKVFRATSGHIGKPVGILINGELVAAPVVRSPIRSSAQVSGDYSRAQAERIAEGMIGK
jgi:preprotein translocase subunit SecD